MVNIKLERDVIIFDVAGWDKLWSFKSSLEIPIAHITDVYADPNPAMGWFEGLKIIGTSIPNIFKAGTFYQEGQVHFTRKVRLFSGTYVIRKTLLLLS